MRATQAQPMVTAGALEQQELMSEGKNLSLQRSSSLKGLPSRRKQRENDREHVAEKLQRRLPKFNQFSQNGVYGRDRCTIQLGLSRDYSARPIKALRTCRSAAHFANSLLTAQRCRKPVVFSCFLERGWPLSGEKPLSQLSAHNALARHQVGYVHEVRTGREI